MAIMHADEWAWCPVTQAPAGVHRVPVEDVFADDRTTVVLVACCVGCGEVVPELGVTTR